MTAATALRVRVVSYNVLSSHLASPFDYPRLNPKHLMASNRLPMILQKLEEELSYNDNNINNNAADPAAASSFTDDPSLTATTLDTTSTTTDDDNVDTTKNTKNTSPVIFCLQEVSYDWAGELHTFFANRGYHLVTGLYGKKFNGYMGVAMAYPTADFETLSVRIQRLSDTRRSNNNGGGWPRPPKSTTTPDATATPSFWLTRLVKQTRSLVTSTTKSVLTWMMTTSSVVVAAITNGSSSSSTQSSSSSVAVVIDPWDYAEYRYNVILGATLRHRSSGQSFCIANYHMPCAFYAPPVMTIHADMALRFVQNMAKTSSSTTSSSPSFLPYIIAGDWNIQPDSNMYRMLTTGQIQNDPTTNNDNDEDPSSTTNCIPPPKYGMTWSISAYHPIQSAYVMYQQQEPDFTNYACVREDAAASSSSSAAKDDDPLSSPRVFIGTLDYIFVSSPLHDWKVIDVKSIPHRSQVHGAPFPNLDHDEPSDHVLIAATLEL